MDKPSKPSFYKCPECDNQITVNKNAVKGMIVECDACGTESEFIKIFPPVLAPLEEEK